MQALSQPAGGFRDGPLQPAPPQVDGSPTAPVAPPAVIASNQERLRELERLVRDEWVAGGGGSLERIRNDGTGAPDPDKGLLDKLGEGHYREQDAKRMLAEERQREYNEFVLDKVASYLISHFLLFFLIHSFFYSFTLFVSPLSCF